MIEPVASSIGCCDVFSSVKAVYYMQEALRKSQATNSELTKEPRCNVTLRHLLYICDNNDYNRHTAMARGRVCKGSSPHTQAMSTSRSRLQASIQSVRDTSQIFNTLLAALKTCFIEYYNVKTVFMTGHIQESRGADGLVIPLPKRERKPPLDYQNLEVTAALLTGNMFDIVGKIAGLLVPVEKIKTELEDTLSVMQRLNQSVLKSYELCKPDFIHELERIDYFIETGKVLSDGCVKKLLSARGLIREHLIDMLVRNLDFWIVDCCHFEDAARPMIS